MIQTVANIAVTFCSLLFAVAAYMAKQGGRHNFFLGLRYNDVEVDSAQEYMTCITDDSAEAISWDTYSITRVRICNHY